MSRHNRNRKRIYFVWIHNHTDSRDDDVLKIKASSPKAAARAASEYAFCRRGVSVGSVFTGKAFKEHHPDWHALLWGTPAKETYDWVEEDAEMTHR